MKKLIKTEISAVLLIFFLLSIVVTGIAYANSVPTITATAPANGTTLNSTTTTLSFTVNDSTGIMNSNYYIKLNGVTQAATIAYLDGHWSGDVCNPTWIVDDYNNATISVYVAGLKDGVQTIDVQAKNTGGAAVTKTWNFTVKVAPTFSSVSPTNGSVTANNLIPITANVQDNDTIDASSATMTIDGIPVPAVYTSSGSSYGYIKYTPATALPNGTHIAVIGIKDMAGNAASYTTTFAINNAGPMISFADDGKTFSDGAPLLTTDVTSVLSLSQYAAMKIDGVSVTPTFTYHGYWGYDTCLGTDVYYVDDYSKATITYQASGLSVGSHTLEVSAKDSAGIIITKTFTFNVGAAATTVQFSSATYSGTEGGSVTITINRTGTTTGTSTINYATSDGTGTAGTSYTAASGTLTFNAGETSKTFTVSSIDDNQYNGDKTVNLTLSSPGSCVLGAQSTAVLSLTEISTQPAVQFSSATASVTEGGSATITVTRSGATGAASTVNYATSNGTAAAGTKYTAASGTITFNAGETSKTFIVSTIDENAYEGSQTVNLTLSSPTGAILGATSTAVLTITDNDTAPTIQFSASTASVTEGGTATITVTRSGATGGSSTVSYATSNGTATAGTDYTASSGTLTFNPGDTTKTFTVATVDNNVYSGALTVNLAISSSTGATLGATSSAVLTINDNDSPPIIQFNASGYSVSEGGSATITVSRTGATGGTSKINYATNNGTAVAGTHYASSSGTITFNPGDTSKTFAVSTIDDFVYGGNATVNLTLSSPVSAAIGTQSTAILTINETDTPTTVQFSSASYSVTEGGSATITVTRIGSTGGTSTVQYTTSDGTASAGSKYTTVTGTITFNAGETSKTFSVPTVDENVYEGTQTVNLTLNSPTGSILGIQSTAILAITDNDSAPTIQFNPESYSVTEGGTATITVTRSGAVGGTSTVNYTTSNGTAAAGSKYIAASGTLTFNPGDTSKTFTVTTVDENVYEGNQTVNLSLTAPSGASVCTVSAVLTINDDDSAPVIQFNSASYSVTEGGTATITVSRSGAIGGTSTVNYATSNGTASAGTKYTASSGTITFGPGETSKTFTVSTVDENVYEGDTTVNLSLSTPGDSVLGSTNTAVLTINDNDLPPVVQFNAAVYTVTEGGNATITVSRTGATGGTTTVNYATSNGTATAGTDYTSTSGTLIFAPTETSKIFTVPTVDDTVYKGSRTVNLTLAIPGGGTIGSQNTAVLTINDNDIPPALELASATYTVTEGNTVMVTVNRTGATGLAATVNYATSDGTAVAGTDYTAASGTLTFNPGDTSKTFTIATLDNNICEGNLNFNVNLSSPTGAALGTTSAVMTISDIDVASNFKLSSATYTVSEGGTATITVNRSGATGAIAKVDYATSNGTADAGPDYTAVSGTITFNPGETSKTFSVPTVDNNVYEGDTTVNMTLSGAVGATLGTPSTAVLTINNTDQPAKLQFNMAAYTVTEGNATTITVTRSGATGATAKVDYTTSNGTASAGADYTAASGTLTFAPGEISKTFTVTTLNNNISEGAITFNLTLSNPTGGTLNTTSNAVVTINDVDVAPKIQLSAATYTVNEGNSVIVTVTRIGALGAAASVNYATSNGTASAGLDYTLESGTLNFNPGDASKTFTVPTVDNNIFEGSLTFDLVLSNPTGADLGNQSSSIITINDIDVAPKVQFCTAASSVTEGNKATITVTRTGAAGAAATVNYATSDGTAIAGPDYTATSGTLTFNPGETSKTLTVSTVSNNVYEGNITINLALTGPVGATLGTPSTAVLTINDTDTAPVVQLGSATYIRDEGSILSIAVNRLGATGGTSTVKYSTSNITAIAGVNYTATSGTVTFNPGETLKLISVTTLHDNAYTGTLTFNLTLSSPTGATLGAVANSVITLNNIDTAPSIQLNPSTYTVTEGGIATITVTRTGATGGSSTVRYATSDGTAAAGTKYIASSGTLTFNPGESSKTFSITTVDETVYEGDKTVNFTLTSPVNATLGTPSAGVLTIKDNDLPAAIQFSTAAYNVNEGSNATITVTRTGNTGSLVSVRYTTGDGTANAGVNYTAASGTITFNPGETTKTFTIATINDNTYEGVNLTANLSLTSPNGANLGNVSTAVLNIKDMNSLPIIQLSSGTSTVSEGNTATITVTRTGATGRSSTVNYATSNLTAVSGKDYTASNGTITFNAGETSKTFTVPTIINGVVEGNLTLKISLTNPVNAALGTTSSTTLTITDTDKPSNIQLGMSSYNVLEGNSVSISVYRSGSTVGTSSVSYSASGGTAIAGSNYTALKGTLTFNPGETVKAIVLNTIDNNIYDGNKTVSVTLASPTGATLGSPVTATVTINEAETSLIRFSAPSYSINEGSLATINVERIGDLSKTATVTYSTSNGSAIMGADYIDASGTLTFNPGDSNKSFTVQTIDNHILDPAKTVNLSLTGVTGSTIAGTNGRNTAAVSITDIDAPKGTLIGLKISTLPLVQVNKTTYIPVLGVYKEGFIADISPAATWSSSYPQVATVSVGNVTGVGKGTTLLSARYGGFSTSFTAVVK